MSLRTLVLSLSLVLSTSLQAGGLTYLGPDTRTLGERLDELRVSRQQMHQQRLHSDVVSVDWEKDAFIIPVAGNAQGANGTYFRSDVTIANRRSVSQQISVGYLQRGVNNGSAQTQRFTIPANFTDIERDFVGSVLHASGIGTILVIAVDANGNADPNAEIDGFSRIWTPQPGSAGTVSQSFEAIDLEDNLAESWGYGLRQDASFRTNVGLINLYSTSNTFTVTAKGLLGEVTFTQTVQPYSMEQVSVPAGTYGDMFIYVKSSDSNLNWWSAYGTSVDNVTGDGWVSHVH